MLELILDTSYRSLNIGILYNSNLIEKVEIEANRRQSEITMSKLNELFVKNEINPLHIKNVIITEGPGSFTGLRIAMTIAKVICSMIDADLYTINTLFSYIHPSINKGLAIMDARSKRAYTMKIQNGMIEEEVKVIELEKIEAQDYLVFGDAHLINAESEQFSIIDNIIANKAHWKKVEDVDSLTPLYLKNEKEYTY